jgi:hypothetical protein
VVRLQRQKSLNRTVVRTTPKKSGTTARKCLCRNRIMQYGLAPKGRI